MIKSHGGFLKYDTVGIWRIFQVAYAEVAIRADMVKYTALIYNAGACRRDATEVNMASVANVAGAVNTVDMSDSESASSTEDATVTMTMGELPPLSLHQLYLSPPPLQSSAPLQAPPLSALPQSAINRTSSGGYRRRRGQGGIKGIAHIFS